MIELKSLPAQAKQKDRQWLKNRYQMGQSKIKKFVLPVSFKFQSAPKTIARLNVNIITIKNVLNSG